MGGWFLRDWTFEDEVELPSQVSGVKDILKPLEKYSIPKLSEAKIPTSRLEIVEKISEEEKHSSYLFKLHFSPGMDGKEKVTTGLINIPKEGNNFPVILMIRGFVSQEIYQTGMGSARAGEYFAQNGFVTIAPDFLGYAGSSENSADIYESRFQTYTTILSLIETIENFPKSLNAAEKKLEIKKPLIDESKMGIWAHSNGGQIALTSLAVTGKNYPTVLWSPVTKPFPYSVLYFTDESPDGGKYIRKELAEFEKLYNTDKYSFTNYLTNIKAPIQIHQGQADNAVPYEWSREAVGMLRAKEIVVDYNEYSNADHNLRPNWDEAVQKSLEFFQTNLVEEEK